MCKCYLTKIWGWSMKTHAFFSFGRCMSSSCGQNHAWFTIEIIILKLPQARHKNLSSRGMFPGDVLKFIFHGRQSQARRALLSHWCVVEQNFNRVQRTHPENFRIALETRRRRMAKLTFVIIAKHTISQEEVFEYNRKNNDIEMIIHNVRNIYI